MEFFLVYIREAHAVDAWPLAVNRREGFEVRLARDYEEKDTYASLCVRKLNIEIPALVDSMDYPVEAHYTAWPDRLYLVDREGKIAYKGRPGPGGFKPSELEAAIKEELAESP